jgi:uncharacterized protein YbjT (DUF2867 family)
MAPLVRRAKPDADPLTIVGDMRILITGGTGVIGRALIDRLIEGGHRVRLLSRHAERDVDRWPERVAPFEADIGEPESLAGATDGCDAIVHIAGIQEEDPPEVTFQRVNVEGTSNLLAEAERGGKVRFIFLSSLGAERGESDYHRSKRRAEMLVEQYPGDWLILRSGNVYGPGDEVISKLLKMVRTLPAVPVISGDHPFEPMWVDDLAAAVVRAIEWKRPSREALDLAGPDRITMEGLLDRLETITDRSPARVRVPEKLALLTARTAETLGITLPANEDQIRMLVEENVIPDDGVNALTEIFDIDPTPLDDGLVKLRDALPEQLPSEGTGAMQRQRYWADIRGSEYDADGLFELLRTKFFELPPEGLLEVGAEPGSPDMPEEDATLTMAIPLRGTVSVRVARIASNSMVFVTMEGHFLAGAIRFAISEREGEGTLRFEIRSYTRFSDRLDEVGMRTVGRPAQKATWEGAVEALVERSGGEAVDGVQSDTEMLEDRDADRVESWVREVVFDREREDPDALIPPA